MPVDGVAVSGAMDDPAFRATCARCGTRFQCSVDAPEGCWCMRVPVLPVDRHAADAGCLCEACLHSLLEQRGVAPAARPAR